MKFRKGFTIVELLVVIVVIGILATVGVMSFLGIQRDARDSERSAKVATITEALEKYYDQNGEYPSPQSLINSVSTNTGSTVAKKLSISANALVFPRAPASMTNSIIAAANGTTYELTYTASSQIGNAACQTNPAGGCDQFTVRYTEESNEVITINSRRSGRPDALPSTPEIAIAPIISASLNATNIQVDVAAATICESVTLTAKYSFTYRVNSGAWSTASAFQTGLTYVIPGSGGNTYDFKAVTRCDNGAVPGTVSPESAIATYVYALDPPTPPTITVGLVGANATATIAPAVTCPSGYVTQYQFRSRLNAAIFGAWPATWATTLTASQAAAEGVKYTYQAQSRCYSSVTSVATAAATGTEVSYIHPILAPAIPVVTLTSTATVTTYTWAAIACPTGTTVRYQYRYLVDYSTPTTSAWYANTSRTFALSTSSQGYQYTLQVQAQCYNTNTTSAWSGTGSNSYIRPVDGPGPISWSIRRGASNIVYVAGTSSCASGINLYSRADIHTWDYAWYGSSNLGWYANTYGSWLVNTMDNYGNKMEIGASGAASGQTYASGSRWNIAVEMKCRNYYTGRESGSTGRVESPILYLP